MDYKYMTDASLSSTAIVFCEFAGAIILESTQINLAGEMFPCNGKDL